MDEQLLFLKRALLGASPRSTAPLHGLRTLLNFTVVAGHIMFYGAAMRSNPIASHSGGSSIFSLIFRTVVACGVYFSVDAFLFMSGFFLVRSILTYFDTSRNRLPPSQAARYMMSRLLRLLPAYSLVILLFTIRGHPPCGLQSISDLLFMSNFTSRFGEHPMLNSMCLMTGWSLNVDVQSHLIVLLLFMLFSLKNVKRVLIFLILGQIALRAQFWKTRGHPVWRMATIVDQLPEPGSPSRMDFAKALHIVLDDHSVAKAEILERRSAAARYFPLYFHTTMRSGPLFVGAVTHLLIDNKSPMVCWLRTHQLVTFSASAFLIGVSLTTMILQQIQSPWLPHFLEFLFEAGGRVTYAIGLSLIVFLTSGEDMSIDENDGGTKRTGGAEARYTQSWVCALLQWCLGNKILVSLARFSYAVYIVHATGLGIIFEWGPKVMKETYTSRNVNWSIIQLYIFSHLLSIPLCIVEELFEPVRLKISGRFDVSKHEEKKD